MKNDSKTKRKRVVKEKMASCACANCRLRHKKCNNQRPCDNCIKFNTECYDVENKKKKSKKKELKYIEGELLEMKKKELIINNEDSKKKKKPKSTKKKAQKESRENADTNGINILLEIALKNDPINQQENSKLIPPENQIISPSSNLIPLQMNNISPTNTLPEIPLDNRVQILNYIPAKNNFRKYNPPKKIINTSPNLIHSNGIVTNNSPLSVNYNINNLPNSHTNNKMFLPVDPFKRVDIQTTQNQSQQTQANSNQIQKNNFSQFNIPHLSYNYANQSSPSDNGKIYSKNGGLNNLHFFANMPKINLIPNFMQNNNQIQRKSIDQRYYNQQTNKVNKIFPKKKFFFFYLTKKIRLIKVKKIKKKKKTTKNKMIKTTSKNFSAISLKKKVMSTANKSEN